MKNKGNEKIIVMVITIIVIALLLWFIIINPLLKFKTMEKELLDASKRYFEINTSMLPTGNKIRKISLQTLHDKDFIQEDLRAPYTKKYCNTENSWVKVSKNGKVYKYSVYLECGMLKSRIDHNGPEITLNGKDEVVVYQGDKYKDAGIKSVIDDTDGKIDISKVKIDESKVNTNKVGTYDITYTISDSLENKTVKVRTVKVIQTLNNIVKKNTDSTRIYKGNNDNNYVMIDGIIFKIVGINSDNSVKIVSNENLASVNYEGIDSWLNDYFYEKLSDSAKKYIVKSKWCDEKVTDPTKYTKCNDYSKKKYVGLLSVADINNSKNNEEISNVNTSIATWTLSSKSNKEAWVYSYYNMSEGGIKEYKEFNNDEFFSVKPVLNIMKDANVSSGDGSQLNPYILDGNNNRYKEGTEISETKTGTYISYSGYKWRIIGKEDDGTTKVIMQEPIKGKNGVFYIPYDSKLVPYNPKRKENLGFNVINKASEYIKTDYFVSKKTIIKEYKKVLYNKEKSTKEYNIKFVNASLFDLYSANTTSGYSTWYQESSDSLVYINSATLGVISSKFDSNEVNSVRLVGYLNKNVKIKSGLGTSNNPFTLTK